MPKSGRNPFRVRNSSLEEITAVILCGGQGTRLRSAVPNLPKCLAPIAGRCFLDYQLDWLHDTGIRDVVLCTGYKAQSVREHCGNGMSHGLLIRYSAEDQPMGTGGALKNAERFIRRGPFLLLNGDSFFEVDLAAMVFDHWFHHAVATVALARPREPGRYASVRLNADEKVARFGCGIDCEDENAPRPCWINAGLYVFERAIFDLIPKALEPLSLEREILPRLVGPRFHGFRSNGYFLDIGTPEDFERSQTELPERLDCVHENSR